MSEARLEIYTALAALLDYPTEDCHQQARAAAALLRTPYPQAAALVEEFGQKTADRSSQQMEELFTRTFDVNPVCCLEVGWHLHGDNYDRGDFMVRMRKQLRELGLEEGSELPDHLTHVLPIIGRLDEAQGDALALESVVPALKRMIDGMVGDDHPYKLVLLALRLVLPQAQAVPAGSAT